MQRRLIPAFSVSIIVAVAVSILLFFSTPSYAACASEQAFATAFNQQQLPELRRFAKQLTDNDCPETIRDKRRYFIASALYQQLTKTIPEAKVTAKDYAEIEQIHAYFWKMKHDLGDIAMKAGDYAGGLKYYRDALVGIDSLAYTPAKQKLLPLLFSPSKKRLITRNYLPACMGIPTP